MENLSIFNMRYLTGAFPLDFPVLGHFFSIFWKYGAPVRWGLGEKPQNWEVCTEGGPIRGGLGGGALVRGGLEGVFNLRQIMCFLRCFYDFRTQGAVLISLFTDFRTQGAFKQIKTRFLNLQITCGVGEEGGTGWSMDKIPNTGSSVLKGGQ